MPKHQARTMFKNEEDQQNPASLSTIDDDDNFHDISCKESNVFSITKSSKCVEKIRAMREKIKLRVKAIELSDRGVFNGPNSLRRSTEADGMDGGIEIHSTPSFLKYKTKQKINLDIQDSPFSMSPVKPKKDDLVESLLSQHIASLHLRLQDAAQAIRFLKQHVIHAITSKDEELRTAQLAMGRAAGRKDPPRPQQGHHATVVANEFDAAFDVLFSELSESDPFHHLRDVKTARRDLEILQRQSSLRRVGSAHSTSLSTRKLLGRNTATRAEDADGDVAAAATQPSLESMGPPLKHPLVLAPHHTC
jgi:hypothetical protein